MSGVSQAKMKKLGRNLARARNQGGTASPPCNLNYGSSDGGVIGRYKRKVHTSIKGGK